LIVQRYKSVFLLKKSVEIFSIIFDLIRRNLQTFT
jgi:hypothetical protein